MILSKNKIFLVVVQIFYFKKPGLFGVFSHAGSLALSDDYASTLAHEKLLKQLLEVLKKNVNVPISPQCFLNSKTKQTEPVI